LFEIEKVVIKALIYGDQGLKTWIMTRFTPEHFSTLSDVFVYVREQLGSGDPNLIAPEALSVNESISQVSRGVIAALAYVPSVQTEGQLEVITDPLIDHYNGKSLVTMITPVLENLQEGKLGARDASSKLMVGLDSFNSTLLIDHRPPLGLGRGMDLQNAINRITTAGSGEYIRTGFRTIDKASGGFSRGDFVVMAAPSSHGKSMGMIQMMLNMLFENPNQRVSALYLTGEVKPEVIWHRCVAARGGYPFKKIRDISMPESLLLEFERTPEEKARKIQEVQQYRDLTTIELTKMNTNLSQSGNRLIIKPFSELRCEDVLKELAEDEYDVVIIDYINLMSSGNDNDPDWLRIKTIGRQLKQIAGKAYNGKGVVMVTGQQLNLETQDLRYSKGLIDDCDVFMKWIVGPDLWESGGGLVEIRIAKGRNIGVSKFQTNFDLTCQRITEVDEHNPAASTTAATLNDPIGGEFNPFAVQGNAFG
jgi:hypothetical protein